MSTVSDATSPSPPQPSQRAMRLAEHNHRKGSIELQAFTKKLMRDTHGVLMQLERVDAGAGDCSVCLGKLGQPVDCECGCKRQCGLVRQLRCCGQPIHSYCLDEYLFRQFNSDLFRGTMDEMLAWMTLGYAVIPATVINEITATKNFMCCPLCRAPFSSESKS